MQNNENESNLIIIERFFSDERAMKRKNIKSEARKSDIKGYAIGWCIMGKICHEIDSRLDEIVCRQSGQSSSWTAHSIQKPL